MNYPLIEKELVQRITNYTFMNKYHKHQTEHVFHTLQLHDKIHNFSWGILYLLIQNASNTPPIETQLNHAASIECLGLAVELLDDFLDKDNTSLNQFSPEDFIFIYTDFLLECLSNMAPRDPFGQATQKLRMALEGEWHDTHLTLHADISENDYFKYILPKSTGFFKALTYYALGDSNNLNAFETLMTLIAEFTQIVNDLNGIKDLSKKDIENLSPTLPLIKFIESNPSKNLDLLKQYKSNKIKRSTLLYEIEKSGSLDYCNQLLILYTDHLKQHISTHFYNNRIRPLLQYFHLETLYETIEVTC